MYAVSSSHACDDTKFGVERVFVAKRSTSCFRLELRVMSRNRPINVITIPVVKAYPRYLRKGAQLVRNPQATKRTKAAMDASRGLRAIVLETANNTVAASCPSSSKTHCWRRLGRPLNLFGDNDNDIKL